MEIGRIGLHVQVHMELLVKAFHEQAFHELPGGETTGLRGIDVPLLGHHAVADEPGVGDERIDAACMHERQ